MLRALAAPSNWAPGRRPPGAHGHGRYRTKVTSGHQPAAPARDADVPAFWQALGLPGLAGVHVHFLPPRMLRRVWAYFDEACPLVGVTWPIRYRWTDGERVAHLASMGVRMFSALAYAHRPDMAEDLNAWTLAFAKATSGCLPSATFYPEPGVLGYVRRAIDDGAAIFKIHLQVGGFSPGEPRLDAVLGPARGRGHPGGDPRGRAGCSRPHRDIRPLTPKPDNQPQITQFSEPRKPGR